MPPPFAVDKPAVECAVTLPASASVAQVDKVRRRTQGVMRHLKQLMTDTEKPTKRARSSPSTIDLVAPLFHAVLTEDRLSPLTRVWFARLQLPVMRQALIDPLGFQDHAHPARCLVANIGTCALGLLDGSWPCGALEQEIERLVLSIERFPLADKPFFESANREFDEFLATSRSHKPSVPTPDRAVCQYDQKERLTAQYRMVICDKLSNEPVQTEIRDFLHDVWAESLAVHTIHKGQEHIETLELKRTAAELIQVNTDLLRRRDRNRAIGKVPQLVQKLRCGMALIGLSTDEQDQHIKRIGANLTDAFLAELKEAAPDEPNTERRSRRRMPKSSHLLASPQIEVEGLQVIDDDADLAWRLWEHALLEQQQKPATTRHSSAAAVPETRPDQVTVPLDYWKIYPGDNL